ncbi:MAG: phosphoglucomutase/phosphomannomutase family protein [bacterium]
MSNIKFGTDGWRAVISDTFTFDNLKKAARATARYFRDKEYIKISVKNKKLLLVGYDNRFHSETFAGIVAEIFAQQGFRVLWSEKSLPTPVLSHAVIARKALGGVMITASHNPAVYNGFKVKMHYGAAAPAGETAVIESYIDTTSSETPSPVRAKITRTSFLDEYVKDVKALVNLRCFSRLPVSLIIDPIHGSGSGLLEHILNKTHITIQSIRNSRDPLFGGVIPEPIEKNIQELIRQVKKADRTIGIAFDGDADRIGLIDEKGNFVNSHQIFALLIWHLIEHKGASGRIIKTISGSFMANRLAKIFGREIVETPIGFKHITEHMLFGDVMIGGEESGGIGFKGHIPERDALLTAMYILEMMAQTGKQLHVLIKDLNAKACPSFYDRIDVNLQEIIDKQIFIKQVKKQIPAVFNIKPKRIQDYDGIKCTWKDDSWILLRISGTEPVLRIYAESSSSKTTQKLLACGKQFQYNQ